MDLRLFPPGSQFYCIHTNTSFIAVFLLEHNCDRSNSPLDFKHSEYKDSFHSHVYASKYIIDTHQISGCTYIILRLKKHTQTCYFSISLTSTYKPGVGRGTSKTMLPFVKWLDDSSFKAWSLLTIFIKTNKKNEENLSLWLLGRFWWFIKKWTKTQLLAFLPILYNKHGWSKQSVTWYPLKRWLKTNSDRVIFFQGWKFNPSGDMMNMYRLPTHHSEQMSILSTRKELLKVCNLQATPSQPGLQAHICQPAKQKPPAHLGGTDTAHLFVSSPSASPPLCQMPISTSFFFLIF